MILTHININPELLIKLVASKLKMWAEAHLQDTWHPQGNPLFRQVQEMRVVTSGMAWCPITHKDCKWLLKHPVSPKGVLSEY